jgi:hypothetical protein
LTDDQPPIAADRPVWVAPDVRLTHPIEPGVLPYKATTGVDLGASANYPPYQLGVAAPSAVGSYAWTSATKTKGRRWQRATGLMGAAVLGLAVVGAASFAVVSTGTLSTANVHGAPSVHALQAINLRQGDLPTGWSVPATVRASSPLTVGGCAGQRDTFPDVIAQAVSPTFRHDTAVVTATSASYASADDVRSDAALFGEAVAPDCWKQQLGAKLIATMAGPGAVTISALQVSLAPGASGGPTNVAGTVSVVATITGSGPPITVYGEVITIIGDQVETQVSLYDVGHPVTAAVRTPVIARLAARVAAF